MNGVGPAFIESIAVIKDETRYEMDPPTYFAMNSSVYDSLTNVLHSNIYPGQLIPAGRTLHIFEIQNSSKGSRLLHGLIQDDGFEVEIVYRSVYAEKWLLDMESAFPHKIN